MVTRSLTKAQPIRRNTAISHPRQCRNCLNFHHVKRQKKRLTVPKGAFIMRASRNKRDRLFRLSSVGRATDC